MTKTGDDILLYSIDGVQFDALKYSDEALEELVKGNKDFAILRVNRVGHAGKNYKFLNAMGDYRLKIAEAEGKNFAAVAGKEGVGGEVLSKYSTKATPQDISRFNFNKYLRDLIGPPPADMVDPHAHHISFKEGNGAWQKELAREGQAILTRNGIDPIFGKENLIWAPNRVCGQHDSAALENVVTKLREVERAGGDYDDFVEVLKKLGDLAAKRR